MAYRIDPALKHSTTPPAFDKGKLHREGLVDRLNAALEKALVVVAAPAGYGKTTLLADFTAHTDLPVSWIRLNEATDVASLVQLTIESLQAKFRGARAIPCPPLSVSSPPESAARVISSWIERAIPEPFVLVIDDVHLLGDGREALRFLDELVRLRPSSMTLIVVGREVPDLSLARVLADGELTGFGPQELSLTRPEVAALAGKLGGRVLDPAQVDQILDLTKGWVAGVVLSGVVAKGVLGGISLIDSPLVSDYLASVVLNRLGDDLRRFALDVSVLRVMSPELCDELLQRDDSSRMLRSLARRGVFLDVSEGDPPSYAFHSLFRTFLASTSDAADHSRRRRFQVRAAVLLERRGSFEAAFTLLREAGELPRGVRLAERHARDLAVAGRIELLESWWKELRELSIAMPELLLALGTAYMDRADLERANELTSMLEGYEARRLPRQYRLRIANLRAGVLLHQGQFTECVAAAEKVIRAKRVLDRPMTLAIALENKAKGLAALKVRLEEAEATAQSAVEIVRTLGDKHALARTLTTLAVVLEAEGEYQRVRVLVEQASSILDEVGSSVEKAYGLTNLAQARHRDGDWEGALQTYGEAVLEAKSAANPFVEAVALYGQADVFNDAGLAIQAAGLYGEGLAIATRIDNSYLTRYGCLRTSVMYRRRGNLAVSNQWIQRAVAIEGSESRPYDATIQIAAIETTAAPRNAIASLRRITRARNRSLSSEEEALACLFLAKAHMAIGDTQKCNEEMSRALTIVGTKGAEQGVAAELAADETLERLLRSIVSGGAVLEVVLGRVELLRAFRRMHSAETDRAADPTAMRFDALGRTQILRGEKPLKGMKRQVREVLLYLVDKKAVTKDAIADVFWPTYPHGRKAANLHTAIHSIRTALGRDTILLEDGTYRVNPALEIQYDVDKFEKAADAAEKLSSGDPRRYFGLTEAVSLYAGPFLIESDSEWTMERRRELELRYLDLVSSLATEALAKDQPQRVLDHLKRALAIDPLRDDVNIHYLETLARLGHSREVSLHYRRYLNLVREELGIDLSEEIRELYKRLIG